ncbi:uncharacterized protein LOC135394757 isoform X2 [Ornithodoros turicata]|uniref:uncharacterized protein LOC135394757 isoform X2 n=1 Tax=Ornithodoros turicata TaxID=34597 RepID=UPI0031395524
MTPYLFSWTGLLFLSVASATRLFNDTTSNTTTDGPTESSTHTVATTLTYLETASTDAQETPSSTASDVTHSTTAHGFAEAGATTQNASTIHTTDNGTLQSNKSTTQTIHTETPTLTTLLPLSTLPLETDATTVLTTTKGTTTVNDTTAPHATEEESSTETTLTTEETTTWTTFFPKRNATTPKRRISDNVMKSTPSTRRLMLVLRGNCSKENLMGDLEQAFKKLSPVENISVTEIHCSTILDVNVTLSAGELQLKQLLRNLSLTRNLPVGEDGSAAHRFVLTDFSVREDVPSDGATSVRPRWVPTDEELIIYIAVGVLFGIVLVIAFVVCTIKCCRRQPTKTLDFLETPHLNLRLEDYSLTRIPRPHTIYADHLRTPTSENGPTPHFGGPGLVQPFDTCIVPLEDAPPRRLKEDRQVHPSSQRMRTFGQTATSPSRTPGPRTRRIDDVEDDSESRRSRSLSSSRERFFLREKS